jgi:Flp pilus assembly pilin Flp
MRKFRKYLTAPLRSLFGDTRAATAIEYALMASGISLAIMSTIWTLGSDVKSNLYDKISAMF